MVMAVVGGFVRVGRTMGSVIIMVQSAVVESGIVRMVGIILVKSVVVKSSGSIVWG